MGDINAYIELCSGSFYERIRKSRQERQNKNYPKVKDIVDTKRGIEKCFKSLAQDRDNEKFVPPFHLWIQNPELRDKGIIAALDLYIDKYNLIIPFRPNEPIELTRITTEIKILKGSIDYFNPVIRQELRFILVLLRSDQRCEQEFWELENAFGNTSKSKATEK